MAVRPDDDVDRALRAFGKPKLLYRSFDGRPTAGGLGLRSGTPAVTAPAGMAAARAEAPSFPLLSAALARARTEQEGPPRSEPRPGASAAPPPRRSEPREAAPARSLMETLVGGGRSAFPSRAATRSAGLDKVGGHGLLPFSRDPVRGSAVGQPPGRDPPLDALFRALGGQSAIPQADTRAAPWSLFARRPA